MSVPLGSLKPVYVVGIGWHRYQSPGDTPYVQLGLKAIRDALADAGIDWASVDESFIGTGRLGMASGRNILRHLGAHGQPLVHVENASASGSAAFRLACVHVAAGINDVALVLGIDKANPIHRENPGIPDFAGNAVSPPVHFALLTDDYVSRHGVKAEDIARVAVKNHGNGANNPNAHRQKPRSLEEVLASPRIAGDLTALQCCPVSEGAAAVIIASEDAIKRLGIDAGRAIRVASSASSSETLTASDREISIGTIAQALADAQTKITDLDILELHDAFAVEEIHYGEASGLCPEGHYIPLLKEGAFDIGGRCAVSPSGGLLAMGHPIGPTGVGQVAEITLQLRGEAGVRQQPNARTGLAHMVGLGAVCYAHLLIRP